MFHSAVLTKTIFNLLIGNIKTYVKLILRNAISKTEIALGGNPVWREEFLL